jgi:WD40 repeat protein
MSDALERGIAAAQAGRRQEAVTALRDAIVQDPRNAEAWLWMARLLDQPQRRRECLQRVLQLQPDHAEAQALLAELDRSTNVTPPLAERPRTGPLSWHTGELPPLPAQPSAEDQAWMERLGLVSAQTPPPAPSAPPVMPPPSPVQTQLQSSPLPKIEPEPVQAVSAEPAQPPMAEPEPVVTQPARQEDSWRQLIRRRSGRLPSTIDAEERTQRLRVFLVFANALLVLVVIYFTFIRPPAGSQFKSLVFRPTPLPSPTLQPTATGQALNQPTPDKFRTQVAQAVLQLTKPADEQALQQAQATLQAATQVALDAQALREQIRNSCDESARAALEAGDQRYLIEKAGLANCDLSGFDFSGMDLSGAVLSEAILIGTNLDHTNLSAADLRGAVIENSQSVDTDLSYARVENATVWITEDTDYNFTGVNLSGANLVLPQELDWTQTPHLSWSPDGSQVATLTRFGIFVLNVQTGAGRRVDLPYSPQDVAWSPDGKLLALTDREQVHLLDTSNWQEQQTAVLSPLTVLGAGWNPTGTLLGVATPEGAAFYDPVEQSFVARLPDCQADVQTIHSAWSADGNRLFCVSGTAITLWDVRNSKTVRTLKAPVKGVRGLAWNGDDVYLALQRKDTVEIWDVQSDESKGVFNATSAVWSPTRRFLLLAAPDGFHRWDVFLMSWQPGGGLLNGQRVLAISPDGASFAYLGPQWVTISPTRRAVSYP